MKYNAGIAILKNDKLKTKTAAELKQIRNEIEIALYEKGTDHQTWEKLVAYLDQVKSQLKKAV